MVCRVLAKELWTARRDWDVVQLRPLDPESATFPALVGALRSIGTVQTYFCFGNWYLRVEGRSYREYQASLPAVLRETIRRKSKKLTEKANGSRESTKLKSVAIIQTFHNQRHRGERKSSYRGHH